MHEPEEWWAWEWKFQFLCAQECNCAACGWVKTQQPLQQFQIKIQWTEWLHEGNTTGDPYA